MPRKITSIAPEKKPRKPRRTIDRYALFSTDLMYRWKLQRSWAQEGEPLHLQLWVMLNPSTGDGQEDDATIKRCMAYAERDGYNGIIIINLFGFVSAEPDALLAVSNPVGADNHMHVEEALRETMGDVVVGWGTWWNDNHHKAAGPMPRPDIESTITAAGRKMVCLGTNLNGTPKHPLYLDKNLPFISYVHNQRNV